MGLEKTAKNAYTCKIERCVVKDMLLVEKNC